MTHLVFKLSGVLYLHFLEFVLESLILEKVKLDGSEGKRLLLSTGRLCLRIRRQSLHISSINFE